MAVGKPGVWGGTALEKPGGSAGSEAKANGETVGDHELLKRKPSREEDLKA